MILSDKDFELLYIKNIETNLNTISDSMLVNYLKNSRYNFLLYKKLINEYNELNNNYEITHENNKKLYTYRPISLNKKNDLYNQISILLISQRKLFYNFNVNIKNLYPSFKNINIQKEIIVEKNNDINTIDHKTINRSNISKNINELRELFKTKKKEIDVISSNTSDSSKKQYKINRQSQETKSLNENIKMTYKLFRKNNTDDDNHSINTVSTSTSDSSKKQYKINRQSQETKSLNENIKKTFKLFRKNNTDDDNSSTHSIQTTNSDNSKKKYKINRIQNNII